MKPVSVSFEIGPKRTKKCYRINVHQDLLLIYFFVVSCSQKFNGISLRPTCVFAAHLHGNQRHPNRIWNQNTLVCVETTRMAAIQTKTKFKTRDLSGYKSIQTLQPQYLSPRNSSVGLSASCARLGTARPTGHKNRVPEKCSLLLALASQLHPWVSPMYRLSPWTTGACPTLMNICKQDVHLHKIINKNISFGKKNRRIFPVSKAFQLCNNLGSPGSTNDTQVILGFSFEPNFPSCGVLKLL